MMQTTKRLMSIGKCEEIECLRNLLREKSPLILRHPTTTSCSSSFLFSLSSRISMSSSDSSSSLDSSSGKAWLPLESNPVLMTKYIHNLGVGEEWNINEIYGLDEDLLAMVPQPVLAVLLLFPLSESSEKHRLEMIEQMEKAEKEGGKEEKEKQTVLSSVYHMKQTVGNACGTIALIHALLNNLSSLSLPSDSWIQKFYNDTKAASFEERAVSLCNDDKIEEKHQGLATEAVSDVNHSINDNLHFICFVEKEGKLIELDGRKPKPIIHSNTTKETLLFDTAKVVREFMERDPNDVRFSLAALCPNVEDF